jgi:ABC-type cobalamin/Fe3+-siderophores transport system ATPase subunit
MESAETQTQEASSVASPLILDSLEIQGFRGFRHLKIERLGRVNLIVGKNSVGKTALLEALWLYANQGALSTVWNILESRDEGNRPIPIRLRRGRSESSDPTLAIKHLFYGRPDVRKPIGGTSILIGPIDDYEKTLSITMIRPGPDFASLLAKNRTDEEVEIAGSLVPCLSIKLGGKSKADWRLDVEPYPAQETARSTCAFIPANGLNLEEIERLWDNIALKNVEQDVVRAMQVINKQVERMNLLSGSSLSDDRSRIPKVRVSNIDEDEPVSLRSLGDGMNRLFGIALALVNAKNGILLIDEVENGLHYSVQPDVWKLIFETARNLNVQVFATTHSWDCIEAFQKAAEESKEYGMLVRLTERKGEIISDVFGERELAIATKQQIELR